MTRSRALSGLIPLLLITTGAAIPSKSASAQEQTPSTAAPTDTPPVRKLGKMDVRHAVRTSCARWTTAAQRRDSGPPLGF
jgi:hypothetical protein